MIGHVDSLRRPILPLTLRGPHEHIGVEALIDTGFSGSFSVTPDVIQRLGLRPYGAAFVQNGHGSSYMASTYIVELDWLDGILRCEAVESKISHCLIGRLLLDGHVLEIDSGPGKTVEVR